MAFNYESKCYPPQTEEEEENEKAIFVSYQEELTLLGQHPDGDDEKCNTVLLFHGHWRDKSIAPAIKVMRDHYKALLDDTFLVAYPKCGTTWLTSLVYTITTRREHPLHLHPILSNNPHRCILLLERLYMKGKKLPRLEVFPSPRFFKTHVFYSDLPVTAKEKRCKVVYICRDPKDSFASAWHWGQRLYSMEARPPTVEEVEAYCQGRSSIGSIWDHVLGYWNAHRENPERVMFLWFEELKRDVKTAVRKLGVFLDCPFTAEEEEEGVVDGIGQLCSLESLKKMEVNRNGFQPGFPKSMGRGKNGVGDGPKSTEQGFVIENKMFFRKGEVGDWVNLLTPEMGEMIDKVTEEKLAGTGFSFRA